MCGISGWIHRCSEMHAEYATLTGMNTTLAHRGPDETGSVLFENAGLAMSRLSIIDLDSGHQPMSNADGTLWIVYNGEIYNFRDLRRELELKQHRFRTRSDTESILHAYAEWGPDCVQRLRGMFAFCIAEISPSAPVGRAEPGKVRGFFLARDRVGKKPLYYYHDTERFVFASEIKALLAHPAVPRRVNRRAIPFYLTYGYIPFPSTMFEGIHELPPGHTLRMQDNQVTVHEYWDINYRSDPLACRSHQDLIGQVQTLLEEAVRVRLISDVPLGAFLSGGLDSTAIVALMTRLTDQPVKTFAIGFADAPSFNELEYARLAARTYGTDHHEFVVQPNAIDLLPKLVWHYDQPFADSSAIPAYLVAKLSRDHVTVVLAGDGGDELFAGYERFAAARLAEVYRYTPQQVQAALAYCLRVLPESTSYDGFVRRARRFIESAPLPLAQRYLGWVSLFHESFIQALLAEDTDVDPARHFRTYFDRVQDLDPIGQLLYVNTKSYLPGDLLVKTDRMSMANSLEVRCPFLDQELLAFAAGLPSNLKLKGLTTKYVLKRALEGTVPREIVYRKKHGFGVPIGYWFRTELKDYVREVLLSPQALRRGYFKEKAVRRLIHEHQSNQRDHGHRLWALLTFEMWHRVFIDSPIAPCTD